MVLSMKRKKYVTISVPNQLYERIQKAIENTGFRSVSEYIVFVTRESLLAHEKEEDKIEKQLKALGYV